VLADQPKCLVQYFVDRVGPDPVIQLERTLQIEVGLKLAAAKPKALVLPIPNGMFLPTHNKHEETIARRWIARMKAECQLVPGAPDLVVLWDTGSGVIELKREAQRTLLGRLPAGRPSEAQLAVEARCKALGIHHSYCHSWDEVHLALRDWGRMR
jgi:hypothetical protein